MTEKEMTAHQMIYEVVESMTAENPDRVMTYDEIRDEVYRRFGKLKKEATINGHVLSKTVNQPARINCTGNFKPRVVDRTTSRDLLYTVGQRQFVKFDVGKHGIWEIRKDANTKKLVVAKHQQRTLLTIARQRFENGNAGGTVHLVGDEKQDAFLNDLEGRPHAFVLACLMDRQIKAEKAWAIPYRIYQELGTFDIFELGEVPEKMYIDIFEKHGLHRFNKDCGSAFYHAVGDIITKYDGDASRIWTGTPSSATVVYRFLEFRGCGIKIATMAANILARQFMIPFSDYYSIEISPDIHIQRVMKRIGYVPQDASIDMIIYKAREISPEFPGLIDFTCWEIGKNYCHATSPKCGLCEIRGECESTYKIRENKEEKS